MSKTYWKIQGSMKSRFLWRPSPNNRWLIIPSSWRISDSHERSCLIVVTCTSIMCRHFQVSITLPHRCLQYDLDRYFIIENSSFFVIIITINLYQRIVEKRFLHKVSILGCRWLMYTIEPQNIFTHLSISLCFTTWQYSLQFQCRSNHCVMNWFTQGDHLAMATIYKISKSQI